MRTLADTLREHGRPERAAEIEATHDSLAGGRRIEAHLHDLVAATRSPVPESDEAGRISWTAPSGSSCR